MQIVAITGSIGCGKTTLSDLIRKMGYVVFDVDKWCRKLYFEDSFLDKIKEVFPQTFVDGVFNKRALRNYVFANPAELKKLENLIHPFLKQKFLRAIHKCAQHNSIIFIDVAILFEMGWDKFCTYIILADTDYETQKKRVMQRDNISAEDFEKIIKVQMNNKEKKDLCHAVVETNKPLSLLKAELIQIIGEVEQKW